MDVDIVIVNYKSEDCLPKCLDSIHRSLNGITAVVRIQNNDPHADLKEFPRLFPDVLITNNKQNIGFGAAVNRALRQSHAPYVLILNPDTTLDDRFFEDVLRFLENHPDVGVLGPRIFDLHGKVQGSARSFPTPLTAFFGRSTTLSRLFPNNPLTRSNILNFQMKDDSPMEVDWVSGACMMARTRAVESVGLFDQRFFMYWEDADWCKRMWENGWKVVYYPQASVVHLGGKSSSQRVYRSILDFHKSSFLFFLKHSRGIDRLLLGVAYFGLSLRACCLMASNFLRNDSGLRQNERRPGQRG